MKMAEIPMSKDSLYDVIVIGGGPAGSTAARRAALDGAKVLLLDAARFPRVKPCGGAVSEQARSYLDFELPESLSHGDVFGARVHFKDTTIEARDRERIAILTTRVEFDSYLLEMAIKGGVEVKAGERVTQVVEQGDLVRVTTAERTYTAKLVIGADGAQGITSRAVRGKLPKDEFAVAYELDAVTVGLPAGGSKDLIEMYFGQEYMGYGWVFVKRDHWNIGVGALASAGQNVKAATMDLMQRATASRPGGESLSTINEVGWIVPAGGYRRRVARGRILLTGDAAGFVDPFYGEGIAFAILSGMAAGKLSASMPSTSRFDVFRIRLKYNAFCRRKIVSNLRYGLIFAKALHKWPDTLLRLFTTDGRFLEKYLDVPAARVSYRTYFWWFAPRAALALASGLFRRAPGAT